MLGDEGAYTPLTPTTAQRAELIQSQSGSSINLEWQILRGISGSEVELEGSPTLTVSGTDVTQAVNQLRKFKGIDLTREVVGWEVRIAFKRHGVTRETTVSKWGRLASISFHPPVPYEVKMFIYGLVPRPPAECGS